VKGQDYDPTTAEKIIAQWPGFAGLLCLAAAGGYIWYAKTYPPHIVYTRPLLMLFAGGMAFLGYWSLASSSNKGNF
jgi:hypothetical protein